MTVSVVSTIGIRTVPVGTRRMLVGFCCQCGAIPKRAVASGGLRRASPFKSAFSYLRPLASDVGTSLSWTQVQPSAGARSPHPSTLRIILVYGVILSKGILPLKASRKLPVVLADAVQCPLKSCGADAERLSMAVRSDMIVSPIGRARMACSSTSFVTPPFRMTVTLVVGAVLTDGEFFRLRDFVLVGGVGLAAAAAYRGWVLIHGCWVVAGFMVAAVLPDFWAASAGVGSGRGGIGGGGVDTAAGGGAGVGVAVGPCDACARASLDGLLGGTCVGVCRGGAAFLVGAGRTTRGSLVAAGLEARGICGGGAGVCALGAFLPCSMTVRRDSKLSNRSVRRPMPSKNILIKAGCGSLESFGACATLRQLWLALTSKYVQSTHGPRLVLGLR